MRLNPLHFRRRKAVERVVIQIEEPTDPPGSVRFQTEIAKQRFIRIEPMGDAVHFMAPRTRLWPGQTDNIAQQLVTRATLPDTVTCGRGYIEVVAFVDDGIVVNEVRTHGDQVLAMAGSSFQPG